jgi:PAS domain S-box-containing protein
VRRPIRPSRSGRAAKRQPAAQPLERRETRLASALHESEERVRAILETAVDGIITIDRRGIIEMVNPAAERMFGYANGELIGQNVTILMPPPYRDEHDGYIAKYLKTGIKKIIGIGREIVGKRKDGTIFPVDLAVSEIDQLQLFTGVIRDITRRKELEREVLEIAVLEQRRIGEELHDYLGQELAGLGMIADALATRMKETAPTESEVAARLVSGLQQAHDQLRSLCSGLVSLQLDPNQLRGALAELATRDRVLSGSGAVCTLDYDDAVHIDDRIVATHLFRIAQEAVSNAVRHGKARNIAISLRNDEESALILTVQDDGRGIQGPLDANKGVGLRIMQNRAGVLGGTLMIGPAERGGTLVTCVIPWSRTRGQSSQ